jgi:hypothetical protein
LLTFGAGIEYKQEARRIAWITYRNIARWFDQWEEDVINPIIAFHNVDGKIEFVDKQGFVNLDETLLLYDGLSRRWGQTYNNVL